MTLAAVGLLVVGTAAAAWILITGRAPSGTVRIVVDSGGLAGSPAAVVLVATALLLAVALCHLAGMLRKVENGRPFETAAGLRGFAFYLFLAVLASILLPPVIQLGLAAGGAGPRSAALSIGGGELLMMLVTGLLFLVARLLDEAQRVDEDARQIV
ncbi:hypothetical protein [Sphingosinicella sp. CPCC 101087]|uniref:hypothetical protein n=1 Tax=Sphingosinicella sp. CPCC 101087 TaxID=2497754 RepID=UPI00101D2F5D|nr:hypothetical protein [Sphingosinicella sp. CPCC 101087]